MGQVLVRRYTQWWDRTWSGCNSQGVGQALVRRYTQSADGPGLGLAVYTVRGWGRPWSGGTHNQRVGQALVQRYTQTGGGTGLGAAVDRLFQSLAVLGEGAVVYVVFSVGDSLEACPLLALVCGCWMILSLCQ